MAWQEIAMGGNWSLCIEGHTGAVKIAGSGLSYPINIPREDAVQLAMVVLNWEDPREKAFDQDAYDQKPLRLA